MGRKEKLVRIDDIKEEMRLVSESYVDYVTITGDVYTNYGNGMYFKKSPRINERNGYVYINIRCKDNKNRGRRLHRIIAKEWLINDDPENKIIIGHYDNNKQNNDISNLYWTTNQENTQKAIDDGLNDQPMGIDNENSDPIGVYTLDNKLIATYGSMRECERCIENMDLTYLVKMVDKKLNYSPRNKFYKYQKISRHDYTVSSDEIKGIALIEKPKGNKRPKIFEATNLSTGEVIICDNQKQFARDHNLHQALISKAVLNNETYGSWKFALIKEIAYTESSGYNNLVDLSKKPVVENVATGETMVFDTQRQLQDYFGLNGHSGTIQYYNTGQLIHSKWKVIDMIQ